MRRYGASAALVVALHVAGCGGGDGGGPTPVTVSIVRTSGLGGSLRADGVLASSSLFVGDIASPPAAEQGLRGFVNFDLTVVPAGATVQSATLRLTQSSTAVAPYAGLGFLVVDQVVYGAALDPGAYDRTFPTSQDITISTDPVLGLKTADVTAAVQNGLASSRVQFRIRFQLETDADGGSEQVVITDSTLTGEPPTLVVTYVL